MKKACAILSTFIMLFAFMAGSCNNDNPTAPSDGKTYTITGIILEGSSGLSAVSVLITGNGVNQTKITNSNGYFAFSGLANGTYTITPLKSGYSFNPSSEDVTINSSDKTAETIIATNTGVGYTVMGLINEGISGLSAVSVRIIGNSVDQTILTDSNGAYAFSALANGTYTITPSKSGYSFNPPSRSVTINGSDKTAETIIATNTGVGYTVMGLINEGITGLSGVSVRIIGNSVNQTIITDSNGAYTFSALANGTYTLTPSKPGYVFTPTSVQVTVNGVDMSIENISATTISG